MALTDPTRVTNLPDSPAGPDSSGVGNMLFNRLNDQYKMGEEAKQTDVLEGIRNKYKMKAMDQANQYDQGMEQLRSNLAQVRTNVAWDHEQQLKQQAATGLEQMVGGMAQGGQPVPGLTQRSGDMEMPTPQYDVNKIDPNNVDMARQLIVQKLGLNMKHEADMTGLSVEAGRAALAKQFDLIDDSDARQANDLANQLDLFGDEQTAAMVRSLYGTPLQGSRSTWQNFQKQGLEKLTAAQASYATKMAIAKEITQRNKDIAGIKADAAKALQKQKNGTRDMQNLGLIHDKMASQARGLDALSKRITERLLLGTGTPQQQAEDRATQYQIETQIEDLNQQMATVRESMKSGVGLPGAPPVPTVDEKDPLGILKGKKNG